MLIDLMQTAIFDSTILYIYLGIFLLSYILMYVSYLYNKQFFQNNYLQVNNHKYAKINQIQMERPPLVNEPFLIWFILMFKRSDEASDQEDCTDSYLKSNRKIRGGLLCKKTTYSLVLKNIFHH